MRSKTTRLVLWLLVTSTPIVLGFAMSIQSKSRYVHTKQKPRADALHVVFCGGRANHQKLLSTRCSRR
jgi:hypothetical protein